MIRPNQFGKIEIVFPDTLYRGRGTFCRGPGGAEWRLCTPPVVPNWPASSPDINPQENVWPIAEQNLRKLEKDGDTFEEFQKHVLKGVRAYPQVSGKKLIPGMTKRMQKVIVQQGGIIGK